MENAVIIDIDNTLVDTAIRKHSIIKSISSEIKLSLNDIKSDFMLSKHLTNEQTKNFFSILSSPKGIKQHKAPLFKNVASTIDWLISKNIKIILLSGRPEKQKKATNIP